MPLRVKDITGNYTVSYVFLLQGTNKEFNAPNKNIVAKQV